MATGPDKFDRKSLPTLIIFSGLPGTGKTAIARELALQIEAVYLRIDSIEQAMLNSGAVKQSLADAGYRVGYALAEDNLQLGRTVIADSVNPIWLTRDAWMDVARRARVRRIEIEVRCSDPLEHRNRVETRRPDVAGLRLPTWGEVASRDYDPWTREHLDIDTAIQSVEKSVQVIRELIRKQ